MKRILALLLAILPLGAWGQANRVDIPLLSTATVTDTLVNALPSSSIVCELNIHGGTHTAAAGEGFQQTTYSATAPVFTFNGTPTAAGTTYFITRRCGP